MKKLFAIALCAFALFASNPVDVQQSGCCSHHGGVSGCSGGRVVCNDGALSPSCTCKGGGNIDKSAANNKDNNSTKS